MPTRGGRLVGVEVKASSKIDRHDFRGLEHLAEATGERFARGVVLYTGTHAVPFGDRLWAMPVQGLWSGYER